MSIVRTRRKMFKEAITDEDKAAKDYKKFPKKIGKTDKSTKALFNKLSDDEKSHAKALRTVE